ASSRHCFSDALAYRHPILSLNHQGAATIAPPSLHDALPIFAYQDGKQMIDFVPGPVTKAMTNGTFLYIDEINMAKPETLPLINGVLDYRRQVTNPLTNEMITAKEGFNVIAAINEGYIGTVPLNEALKNRFIVIDVPYIEGKQLKKLITANTKLTDDHAIEAFV